MPRQQLRVGIVGFGIAGGALALLLVRAGHSVTVFERAPFVGPVGTGLLLQPSGQFVLHRLGLLDAVTQKSEPIYELYAQQPNGATLVRLRYAEVAPGCCGYGVHRGMLFDALRTAANSEANIKIVLDCEIVGWREQNQKVLAVAANGEEHGDFDFLVAADGARSGLRQALDPHLTAHEYDFGAMWMIGRCTQVRYRLQQTVDGTRHLLGLLPVGDERCTLFWSLPAAEIERVRDAGFARWRAEVTKLSTLADEVLADVNGFERVTFTAYRHAVMKRTDNKHVVCIGDAAHAMSPHLGQGANLALLDAECLARALAAAATPAQAFELYQQERRAHIRYYGLLSRFLTPFFQSPGRLRGIGRDVALPLMCRFAPTRKLMVFSMAGIKRGFFESNLNIEALPSHSRAANIEQAVVK